MSGLQTPPRLLYRQPESICRTLVYHWGALLSMTSINETHIIGGIAYITEKKTKTLQAVVDTHAGTKTKAYADPSGVSETNTINFQSKDLTYRGRALVMKTNLSVDDQEGRIRAAVENGIKTAGAHSALAISLHYRYPTDNNRTSGHTVGVFNSKGGIGKRGIGARFFDPNVGTWRFKETKTALDFFSGDWLPNFLAGTVTADPGHPALRPRELTYFRLVTIEPV